MKWENVALKCFIKRYRDTMIVFILFIINLKLINLTKKNYDNTIIRIFESCYLLITSTIKSFIFKKTYDTKIKVLQFYHPQTHRLHLSVVLIMRYAVTINTHD